jgi:hypothetical protein
MRPTFELAAIFVAAGLGSIVTATGLNAQTTITETGVITQDTIQNTVAQNLNLNLVGQDFTFIATFDPSSAAPVTGCNGGGVVCYDFGSGSSTFSTAGYSLFFPTSTFVNGVSSFLFGTHRDQMGSQRLSCTTRLLVLRL